jgi:hypothetical protein
LGREAHCEFMEQSGLVEDLLARARGEELALRMRIAHHSNPVKGELNREFCDALTELGVPSVTGASEGFSRRGLESIPEVKVAVRDAWLSLEGLRRQIEAAAQGEQIPTWPVSIFAE